MTQIFAFFGKWKWVLWVAAFAAIYFMWLRVENLTLERDTAVQARDVADKAREASERLRKAQIQALEKVSKENHERQNFIIENTKAIEQGRAAGDGPLAPVLRATAERLRKRSASVGNP